MTSPKSRRPRKPRAVSATPPRGTLRVVAAGNEPAPATIDHPARWSRPHVRTVVVASGKGGVGKSVLAANLAVALGELGARVLLVDADLAQANLDLLLGVHPRYDLRHVLLGQKSLEEIVMEAATNVRLVPAASGVPELADLDDYRREFLLRALGQLEHDCDLVLIDTPSGVSRSVTGLCLAADDVIVVTTPEMPATSDAYALVKMLQQQGMTRSPHLVVSMVGTPEEAEETTHYLRLVARRFLRLELDPWGPVALDAAVPRAVRRQEPVVTAFPQSPSACAFRSFAERLWQKQEPDPSERPTPAEERLEA